MIFSIINSSFLFRISVLVCIFLFLLLLIWGSLVIKGQLYASAIIYTLSCNPCHIINNVIVVNRSEGWSCLSIGSCTISLFIFINVISKRSSIIFFLKGSKHLHCFILLAHAIELDLWVILTRSGSNCCLRRLQISKW
jgi:hypothetical protein